VEKGDDEAGGGIVAGYRVVDVKVDFYDGKDPPAGWIRRNIAFQIAGYSRSKNHSWPPGPACSSLLTRGNPDPEDCMGKVMGDRSSRRGKIQAWMWKLVFN